MEQFSVFECGASGCIPDTVQPPCPCKGPSGKDAWCGFVAVHGRAWMECQIPVGTGASACPAGALRSFTNPVGRRGTAPVCPDSGTPLRYSQDKRQQNKRIP